MSVAQSTRSSSSRKYVYYNVQYTYMYNLLQFVASLSNIWKMTENTTSCLKNNTYDPVCHNSALNFLTKQKFFIL